MHRALSATLLAGALAAAATGCRGRDDAPQAPRAQVVVSVEGPHDTAELDHRVSAPLAGALADLAGARVHVVATNGGVTAVVTARRDAGRLLDEVRARVARAGLPGELAPAIGAATRARVAPCAGDEELVVEVDLARAMSFAIDPFEVVAALRALDASSPAGRVVGGADVVIRAHGKADPVEALAAHPIAVRGDGAPVRVADVGRIVRAPGPAHCGERPRDAARAGPVATAELHGADLDWMRLAARALGDRLRGAAGVIAVTPSGTEGEPELRVELDRARAAARGVTAHEVARAVSLATRGEVAATWFEGGRATPVRVVVRPDDHDEIRLRTAGGHVVRVHDVAALVEVEVPRELHRCGRGRCVLVRLELSPDVSAADLLALGRRAGAVDLPPGTTVAWDVAP